MKLANATALQGAAQRGRDLSILGSHEARSAGFSRGRLSFWLAGLLSFLGFLESLVDLVDGTNRW